MKEKNPHLLQHIHRLLSPEQRRQGYRIACMALLRALLDFAGVAALIPVLWVALKPDSNRSTLLLCGAVLLFVSLKNGGIMWLAHQQSAFQLAIYQDFSRRMFMNYYHQGMLFLKDKSCVQLGYEVNYFCYAFSLNVLAPLLRLLSDVALSLLMVLVLFIWKPLTGLLLSGTFALLCWLYIKGVHKYLKQYGTWELEARRTQSRTVVETLRGYAELEIANAFDTSLESFEKGMKTIAHCRLRTELFQLCPLFLSEVALVGGLVLLIGIGDAEPGLMSGVLAVAAFRLVPAVRNILNNWGTLQNASPIIAVMEKGLDTKELQPPSPSSTIPPLTFTRTIELRNGTFTFPDGYILFSGLNLSIHKGERIGIRGSSGSGKSTLFNLLLGFLSLSAGEICIDGRKLTPENRKEWHRLTGYVPQEIFIIAGSLADNIALGQASVDKQKVLRVLKQVQLKEWADRLPQGLDTPLGEYGSRLSGGQKQRIGIARALYKEAEILFFDEATSALDNQTEQEITHALEQLSDEHRELTLIIIAHRESSLALCQRIINLSEV